MLMSVYTILIPAQVESFLLQYDLQLADLTPITAGIENTNYFVKTIDGRQWVLTLFEALSPLEIAPIQQVLQLLQTADLPVACPVLNLRRQTLGQLENKPAQLAPRLAGQSPIDVSDRQAAIMGQALARMHRALENTALKQTQGHDCRWWREQATQARSTLPATQQATLDTLLTHFDQVDLAALPHGLIHGDLFRDNTLFIDDDLTGLLDFSEVTRDVQLMDIAICINDFCRDGNQVVLDTSKQWAFCYGYEMVRPLTREEKLALPLFLAMAACRFWLSRLSIQAQNQQQQRHGEHVVHKDPDEMYRMMQHRLQYAGLIV